MQQEDKSKNEYNFARKLFASAYRAGLIDAEEIGDVNAYNDYETEVSVPGVYKRINEYKSYDVKTWRLKLIEMLGDAYKMSSTDMNILFSPRLGIQCIFPLSLEFYLLGICDWNDNPSLHDFSVIPRRKMVRWTRDGIKSMTRAGLVTMVQQFCYKRCMIDNGDDKNECSLPKKRYEAFAMMMYYQLNAPKYKQDIYI